jgi:hypothetical protein
VLSAREVLPPLQLVAVTHEATLRQAVGSSRITREQLEALVGRRADPTRGCTCFRSRLRRCSR